MSDFAGDLSPEAALCSDETNTQTANISETLFYENMASISIHEGAPFSPAFQRQFWDLAHEVFCAVSHPAKSCEDCLVHIKDLVDLVGALQRPSLAAALALDVIVQRAMYELSDKMCRDPAGPAADCASAACSARNIELCIALMLQAVSPLIAYVADAFHAPPQLTERVSTLTRQLQELLAWSSSRAQAAVPDSFPRYPARAAGDGPDGVLLEDARRSPRGTGSLYPAPNNPALSSYSNPTVRVLDDTLGGMLTEVCAQHGAPPALVDRVQATLHRALNEPSQHNMGGPEVGVAFCGALALGLVDYDARQEMDFASFAPPLNCNYHSQGLEAKREEMRRVQALRREARALECVLRAELLLEQSLKHFRACTKDFRNLAHDFAARLLDRRPGGGFSEQQPGGGGGFPSARSVDSSRVSPRGVRGGAGDNSSIDVGRDPHKQLSAAELSAVVFALKGEADQLGAAGEAATDRFCQDRDRAAKRSPQVAARLRRLEIVLEQLERGEVERFAAVRRTAKALERALKDFGYAGVRTVAHKTRFLTLKFAHQEYGLGPDGVACSLVVHNILPLQSCELLGVYLALDGSGKVRDLLHVVKLFAKAHRICDAAAGFLSSFAWCVLVLHVLLRHGFLPNVHGDLAYRADEDGAAQGAGSLASPPGRRYLPARYVARLENVSVMELLDLFFRYFAERFDVFGAVASLRGSGETLRKQSWQRGQVVLWRLSIEDPFDHMSSPHPHDLGATLSRPGQLTTFKALRRAVYGIHSIVAMGVDTCTSNIRKLFSRTDLIHLARRSDYLGAVIAPSPAWVRPEGFAQRLQQQQRRDDLEAADAEAVLRELGPGEAEIAASSNSNSNNSGCSPFGEQHPPDSQRTPPTSGRYPGPDRIALSDRGGQAAQTLSSPIPPHTYQQHQQLQAQQRGQFSTAPANHGMALSAQQVAGRGIPLLALGPQSAPGMSRGDLAHHSPRPVDAFAQPQQLSPRRPQPTWQQYPLDARGAHQGSTQLTPRHTGHSAPNSARLSHGSADSSPFNSARREGDDPRPFDSPGRRADPGHGHAYSQQPSAQWSSRPDPHSGPGYSSGSGPLHLAAGLHGEAPARGLRPSAAEFCPQGFGAHEPSSKPRRQQPNVPLIALSQLQQQSGGTETRHYQAGRALGDSARGEESGSGGRYLDLSSLNSTARLASPFPLQQQQQQQQQQPTNRSIDSAGRRDAQSQVMSCGPADDGAQFQQRQSSEFQQIMEKMTSDALHLSHSLVSARSNASTGTVMSARSVAASGATTVERHSLGSASATSTPRLAAHLGLEAADYGAASSPSAPSHLRHPQSFLDGGHALPVPAAQWSPRRPPDHPYYHN